MVTGLTCNRPLICERFTERVLKASYNKGHSLINSAKFCMDCLAYLYTRCRYMRCLSRREVIVINSLLNGLNSDRTIEKDAQLLFEKIIKEPIKTNKKLSNSLKILKSESKVFGANQNCEKNLRLLQELSYGISSLKKTVKVEKINKKLITILNHDSTDLLKAGLSAADKLEINETYFVYLASKVYGHYKTLKHYFPESPLNNEFDKTAQFFKNCEITVNRCWEKANKRDTTLVFISENKCQAAHDKPAKIFRSIREFIRRGDALHVSMLTGNVQRNFPVQAHVTENCFEETPLRFIELLACDFISLDLNKLLTQDGRERLISVGFASDNDALKLLIENLWTEELTKILDCQRKVCIKNSTLRKFLNAVKWFGLSSKNVTFDLDKPVKKMVCSEFIILLISEVIDRVEMGLKSSSTPDGEAETEDRILTNPFKSMPAYAMTPGDLQAALKNYSTPCASSDFLRSITTL